MASAKQKAGGGGAGSLVTTAIGVYLGNSSHPHWATALYIAAGIAAVYAALQWQWIQRLLGLQPIEMPKFPEHGETVANAGRDNSGSQFVANNSPIYGTDALKILHAKETAPPVQKAPREYPKLHWRFRYARVKGNNNIWRESDSGFGYQSLVVDISAELPHLGSRVRRCALYGSVRLVGNDPRHAGFLNRLCWINEAANEMDFETGKSATLFVVCFEHDKGRPGPEWKSFQCKLNRIPDHPFYRQDFEFKDNMGRMTIPVEGVPTITVSMIDANTEHVVDTRTVRLNILDAEDWRAEEI